jgi:precorrin-8X/cobalt-precorrin-8 methylmutase
MMVKTKMIEEDYSDLGATTPEAQRISSKSRAIIRNLVGDTSMEDRIRQRCSIATGDAQIAELLRFVGDPVSAGLKALAEGRDIFVDIKMVDAGVTRKGHSSSVTAFIGQGDMLAMSEGITRTSAGLLALSDRLSGSISVIGNAPSALLVLCDLIEKGSVTPSLVIGVPVGFVNAAESKERLRALDVPSITTVGTRGGSPIAVAAMNEIINIYHQSAGCR